MILQSFLSLKRPANLFLFNAWLSASRNVFMLPTPSYPLNWVPEYHSILLWRLLGSNPTPYHHSFPKWTLTLPPQLGNQRYKREDSCAVVFFPWMDVWKVPRISSCRPKLPFLSINTRKHLLYRHVTLCLKCSRQAFLSSSETWWTGSRSTTHSVLGPSKHAPRKKCC